MLAHIGGIPVEETLLSLMPVFATVTAAATIGARRLLARAFKARAAKRRSTAGSGLSAGSPAP